MALWWHFQVALALVALVCATAIPQEHDAHHDMTSSQDTSSEGEWMHSESIATHEVEKVHDQTSTDNAPDFCKDLACPSFQLLTNDPVHDFQIRLYDSSSWLMTSDAFQCGDNSFMEGTATAFVRLFEYINGNNDSEERMKMTAPVIVGWKNAGHDTCPATIEMGFYLAPSTLPAPAPSSNKLEIKNCPSAKVAVVSFSGYVRSFENDIAPMVEKLHEALAQHGATVAEDMVWFAGYDDPTVPDALRHNEVGVMIE